MQGTVRVGSFRHYKLQFKISRGTINRLINDENLELIVFQDMTDVFDRCQRKEAQRLQTFKDTLFQIHKCLNVSADPE